MKTGPMKHKEAAILLICILAIFIRLGMSEIQPWDEGLYAMRAKSILEHDDFFDQSGHALGGMYSATYPPLTVWLISGSIAALGEKAFAVRLPSALSAAGCIILIFLLSRRLMSRELSLLAPVLLAGSYTWNFYSRQGMTDIPVIFFGLLALWAAVNVYESSEKKDFIRYSLFFALSFAASLMSKIIITFLPFVLILPFLIRSKNKLAVKHLVVSSIIAFVAAAPWYIFMASKHGSVFTDAFLLPHVYRAVEGNAPGLGIGFYLNQLAVSNPFSLIPFCLFLFAIFARKKLTSELKRLKSNRLLLSSMIWFFGMFIVFSVSRTKLSFYTNYMMPPAIILSVWFLDKLFYRIASENLKWIFISGLYIIFAWSISFDIRQSVKHIFGSGDATAAFTFFGISFLLVFGGLIFNRLRKEQMASVAYSIAITVLPAILILRVAALNYFVTTGHIHGAVAPAKAIIKYDFDSFVYLYHEYTTADSLNPQLAWYTEGWTAGWIEGKSFVPVGIPQNSPGLDQLRILDNYPSQVLLYHFSETEGIQKFIINEIKKTRPLLILTENYALFGTWRNKSKDGSLALLH